MSSEFAKLKKELLFHEKRLCLLLATSVAEDMSYALNERQTSRSSCLTECAEALQHLASNACESKLSGRWNETRVGSTYSLEVPLMAVVGSEKFEKPLVPASDVAQTLENVQKLSQRFSEFAPSEEQQPQCDEQKRSFLSLLQETQWTAKDMDRMKNAITGKLSVLTEITELADALRDSRIQISGLELNLNSLRQQEADSTEDGEMALADSAIRERLNVLQKILYHLQFQAHTVESSVDSNVKKRRSNTVLFQEGIAVLGCVRNEKRSLVEACQSDLRRLERGIAYDEANRADSKSQASIRQSEQRLKDLDERQHMLSSRLERVVREFHEVEEALRELGNERFQAITDHIDRIESCRHLNADENEKLKFISQYQKNLQRTKTESEKSIEAIDALEKLLLRQTTFDEYDFQGTSKRFVNMQRRVAVEMGQTLAEFERCSAVLLRRVGAQLKAVSEQVDDNIAESELKKETYDPLAKKYVTRARELSAVRDQLMAEVNQLRTVVQQERQACMAKMQQYLPPEELIDISDSVVMDAAAHVEDLLDYRQELLEPPEVDIMAERLRVTRELQIGAVSAVARAPIRRSANAASRVLAIREDVQRATEKDSALVTSTTTAAAAPSAAAEHSEVSEEMSNVSHISPAGGDEASVNDISVALLGQQHKANEARAMRYRGVARVIGGSERASSSLD